MKQSEVIKALCSLCTEVNNEVFNWEHPSDCICGQEGENFQFSPLILGFIQSAVRVEIERVKLKNQDRISEEFDRLSREYDNSKDGFFPDTLDILD